MTGAVSPHATIGFLGPSGTFTEEALRSEPGLARAQLRPLPSFVHVLVGRHRWDRGLRLRGPGELHRGHGVDRPRPAGVRARPDHRPARSSCRYRRTCWLLPGATLFDIRRIVSFPHATGQCRAWLTANLPDTEEAAARSTAEAVRLVAEGGDRQSGATARRWPPSCTGWRCWPRASRTRSATRPASSRRSARCRYTGGRQGTTRRAWSVFNPATIPGSLHGILGQFSARDLNLVKLESRPTKRELGEYCFIIDFEGHVADEVVADCLRDLHASLRQLKFLGSYPAAGAHGPARRRDAEMAWKAADRWIDDVRSHIRANSVP